MVDELMMHIGGRWVDGTGDKPFEVFDPATGQVIATAPQASREDVGEAVAFARAAFDEGVWWPRVSERDRGRILLRAAEIVDRERDRLAQLECLDTGKPISEARDDIDEVTELLEYYGGYATKLDGFIPPAGPDGLSLVIHEPVGVVAGITPWNYPLATAIQKIAPAIAVGCVFILKPAQQTPLTALELPKIFDEAGLPAGILQVVTGDGPGAGAFLVSHPQVDKISFTGSREVGRLIMKTAADSLKRVTLELGGKSPNIVFSDADLDEAVEGSFTGVFDNQGEVCTAGSRVLIERRVYDSVLEGLVERLGNVRLGAGQDEETTMGPLVSQGQQQRVQNYIEIGRREARLAASGELPTAPSLSEGYFVAPTIFADVDNESTIAQDEIFGPVMCVIPFSGEEEAIRLANDTAYGLAAAIWSRDISKALNVAKAVRAGSVWINDTQVVPIGAPFGGYKQSGFGRELGKEGLLDFTETKHMYISLGNK